MKLWYSLYLLILVFLVPAACITPSPLIDSLIARVVVKILASRGDYLSNSSSSIIIAVYFDSVIKTVYRFDIHFSKYVEEEQYGLKYIKGKSNYIALIYGEISCVSSQYYNPDILLLNISFRFLFWISIQIGAVERSINIQKF